MIKISFVITLYNKEEHIEGVLNSILEQTGDFEREIVIINDGSTDNSFQLVQSLTEAWSNVVLVNQENQGVSIATNNAVKHARGDYIKLVDADDILAPFATELLLETIQKTGHDFAFAISGEYKDKAVFTRQENPALREFPDPLMAAIEKGYARVSHCLFKKDIFDQVGGCDERVFVQDTSMFLRLASTGNLVQVLETICASPEEEPGRIMNNNAQIHHDASLALANFIHDGLRFSKKHKKAAQKKIVSRMWKWARKTHNVGFFSIEFLIYLVGRSGWPFSSQLLVDLCAVFRKNTTIRRSPPPKQ